MNWVIWSEEHGAWWKKAYTGYTRSLKDAGRYSEDAARKICEDANKHLVAGWNECCLPDPLEVPCSHRWITPEGSYTRCEICGALPPSQQPME